MDLTLTPDLIAVQRRARAFCDDHLVPHEELCEANDGLPLDVYESIKPHVVAAGLNAINIPREWGGQGMSVLEQVLVEEQLGRATNAIWACMWRPANILMHCDEWQRETYLVPECRGDRRHAYAITEEHAGSDPSTLATTAVRVDGGWRLDGEKWFVTDGDIADYLIVIAEVAGHGQTAFLVDKGLPGVRETRRPKYMHTFAFEHPEFVLEDVRVEDRHLLGGLGRGNELTKEWFTDERIYIAARCLGGAQRALEIALDYARSREQFGAPIATYQGVSFQLADSAVELAAARALTYQIAWEATRGLEPKTLHAKASSVKLYASEMAGRVVDRAVQVLGGRGYMRENPCERLYRDLRVDRIWEGTSEIQRAIVANELVKRGPHAVTAWPV
jgi:acyl-CoA dehydrogenase